MTREEYKALILIEFFDLDHYISSKIKWFGTDPSGQFWGFGDVPVIHEEDVERDILKSVWASSSGLSSNEFYLFRFKDSMDYDWRESLISIEELFDE